MWFWNFYAHYFSETFSVQKNVKNRSTPWKSEFEYSKILANLPSEQVFYRNYSLDAPDAVIMI